MKNEKNRMLRWALRYHQLGWNVIPIQSNREPFKGFGWKHYQTKRITEEQIRNWWGVVYPCAGIALITGKISGVLGLDIDAKHGRSFGQFNISPTLVSRTQTDGWHVFFKYPNYEVRSDDTLFGTGAGIKAEGGLLVLPPTQGESGPYRWDCGIFEPHLIDDIQDFLVDAIRTKQAAATKVDLSQVVKGVPDGQRNNSACALIGKLIRHLPESDWYIAEEYMRDWNKKCVPPMSEKVLATKLEGLFKKEKLRRGVQNSSGVTDLKPMKIDELCKLNLPPTDWDVKGLFEHGTPNMLSAAPNNFKTWLVDVIAISIAKGEKLFGEFDTKQQGVLIISEEDGVGITKNRFEMLLKGGKKDLPIYLHIQKGFKLTEEFADQLLTQAKDLKVTFVMFDSLRAVHLADENNSQEMQKVMDLLMKFTREGITVLFTHHHRKKMRGVGAKQDGTGEEARGSTSINAAVHGHITCEHKVIDGEDKLVITQPKLKCAEKLKPFKVGMIFSPDADSAKFVFEGEYADEDMKELVRKKVVSVLNSDGKWLNKKQLRDEIKVGGETTLNAALNELVSEKILVSKPRNDIEKLRLPHVGEGAHNSNYYQLEENDDF